MATIENPLPGMNPFLERFWPDVHTRMMVYLCNALQPLLPDGLMARVEEHLMIDDEGAPNPIRFRADVLVAHHWSSGGTREMEGGLMVTDPDVYQTIEREIERRIEIIDVRGGGTPVTVIEVLSPTNKREGAEAYRNKCELCRAGGLSVVEIDLLRGGRHEVAVERDRIPPHKIAGYIVCVAAAEGSGFLEAWHVPLWSRLPVIPIPLRPGEPRAAVDLQPLVDAAYRDGCYHRVIDYEAPLDPPLAAGDLDQLRGYLAAAESGR